MIIVESGATKSAWRILDADGNIVREFFRMGMNVSTMRMEDILRNISEAFGTEDLGACDGFYLYTAGVVTGSIREEIVSHVHSISGIGPIDVQDDLTGAARAVCGHQPGIAAILGTGSNACFYDGKSVSRNVYSGGFIIGDEGIIKVTHIVIHGAAAGVATDDLDVVGIHKFPIDLLQGILIAADDDGIGILPQNQPVAAGGIL